MKNAPPVFSSAWQSDLQARLSAAKSDRRKANRKKFAARDIWTLDCETDPFKEGRIPAPFIWGLYDGGRDEYHEFTDVNELCEFIINKPILIYAHNGGKFDYHFMKPHFNDDETIMVIGQRIAKFRIGEAELRDSVNLLPIALRDFQKDDIDYAIMEADERHKPHNWRTIQLYLKSDCVNLYNIVREFLTRYGKHLTQAGASMKYWSKASGIDIPRQSKFRYQEMKPYYYGGRVQCFKSGYKETPFKVIDINSAYPYAMTFKHPFSVDYDSGRKLPKSEADIQTSQIRS